MALIKHANLKDLAREAIVLDLGDLARQGQGIIEAAQARAERILADALAERARLIADATDQGRAQGLALGMDEGRKLGHAEGYAAALAERRPQLEQLDTRWASTLEGLVDARRHMLADARSDLLSLSCRMASLVTKRAIALDPMMVVDQLRAVLELVLRPTRLRISINPGDRELILAALPGVIQACTAAEHVELVDEPALARGSVVARLAESAEGGPGGSIDAGIDTQLERIIETLLPGVGAKVSVSSISSPSAPNRGPEDEGAT